MSQIVSGGQSGMDRVALYGPRLDRQPDRHVTALEYAGFLKHSLPAVRERDLPIKMIGIVELSPRSADRPASAVIGACSVLETRHPTHPGRRRYL